VDKTSPKATRAVTKNLLLIIYTLLLALRLARVCLIRQDQREGRPIRPLEALRMREAGAGAFVTKTGSMENLPDAIFKRGRRPARCGPGASKPRDQR
jgi:hypothetical protein